MANNNDYITETYQSLRGRLSASIKRMLNSSDEAADIIQETFCRLWIHKDSIGNVDEAAALATTTARNICIDRLRSDSRHPSVAVDEQRDSRTTSSVDKDYEMKEQFDIVSRIINERLTTTQRQIMQMKEFDDLSYSEIAQRLSMDETAVRMHVSRARKTIKEIYKEANI